MGFTTATEFYQRRMELVCIRSGSADLDKLLGGRGLPSLFVQTVLPTHSFVFRQTAWRRERLPRSLASSGRARRSCATRLPLPASCLVRWAAVRASVSTSTPRGLFGRSGCFRLLNGGFGSLIFRELRLIVFCVHFRYNLNGEEVLDNIAYARAHNTDHQSALLIQAAAMMQESR